MLPDEEDLLDRNWNETAPTRTYHYRTRTTRAMAWFATVFASLPLLMYFPAHNGYTVRDNSAGLPFLIVPLSGLTVYLWWRYFAAKVVTDFHGVTHFSPRGKKFIAWGDILDMKQTSGQEVPVPTLT